MFGKNKREKDAAAQGPSPFDIGKNGTVEEILLANVTAFNKGDFVTVQQQLLRGAIAAFNEGRPETIQTLLSDPARFRTLLRGNGRDIPPGILFTLAQGSDRPAAVMTLALEKAPEEKKQDVLDNALYSHVVTAYRGTDEFIAALLKNGADANAERNGFKGYILAQAIEKIRPLSVIKLLHENGASFEDALFLMQANKWKGEYITSLKAYREQVTGQPATEEGEVLKTLNLLRQEIAEMRQEMTKQRPKPANANSPAKAKTTPAAKGPATP